MSLSRFYLPQQEWKPEELVLVGDEAQHCARVLRRQVGDQVEVFDGTGRVAATEITGVSKTEVRLCILNTEQHSPLAGEIHLMPALIKAEPFEWLLEKAVELGAASIQPVITTRTVVHLDGAQLEKKLAKWRRHMLESAKQCHTPFLPVLHAPRPLSVVLNEAPASALKLIPALSERTRSLHDVMADVSDHSPKEACVVIGPEGDFTPEEEALAQQHGFQPITLGPLVLRAETAGIAMLAVLGHEFRRSQPSSG